MIAAMIVMTGCSKSARLPTTVTVVQKKDEPARTVHVVLGDTVLVEMPGSMAEGYMWELLPLDPETAGMALVEGRYTPPDVKAGAGAPGRFTYVMRTIHVGEENLEFVYRRTLEKSKPPAKTFTVTVKIR